MSNCLGKALNKFEKDVELRNSKCRKSLASSSCNTKAKKQDKRGRTTLCTSGKPTIKENAASNPQEKKYNTPQMNSVLREVNQINHVENLQPTLFRKDVDLTPRSRAAIAPKITKMLNFNADEIVFKNLTPLNVNDSILIQKQCNTDPNKFKKLKVPAPELCHWLEQQPAIKLTVPEPELILEFCDVVTDPFESYTHMLN